MPHLSFPNESAEYRTARNALLDAEIALRRQLEAVAVQRRALPPGGAVHEDFVFERIGAQQRPEQVRLSELFGDHPSILLYSFMYGPERDEPCTGCTHTLDGLDGSVFHADQRFPHLCRRQVTDRPAGSVGTGARLAQPPDALDRWQRLLTPLFRRHVENRPGDARGARLRAWRELG